MTRDDFADLTRATVSDRVRAAAVRAVPELVTEEEMTEYPGTRHRERTESRTGERNGGYGRDLVMPVGKIERHISHNQGPELRARSDVEAASRCRPPGAAPTEIPNASTEHRARTRSPIVPFDSIVA